MVKDENSGTEGEGRAVSEEVGSIVDDEEGFVSTENITVLEKL